MGNIYQVHRRFYYSGSNEYLSPIPGKHNFLSLSSVITITITIYFIDIRPAIPILCEIRKFNLQSTGFDFEMIKNFP